MAGGKGRGGGATLTANYIRHQHGKESEVTTPPFDVVDTTDELLTETRETLAAALATTRSKAWAGKPWKIYDSEGEVVRTYGDD